MVFMQPYEVSSADFVEVRFVNSTFFRANNSREIRED
jgi:hypothetical protein